MNDKHAKVLGSGEPGSAPARRQGSVATPSEPGTRSHRNLRGGRFPAGSHAPRLPGSTPGPATIPEDRQLCRSDSCLTTPYCFPDSLEVVCRHWCTSMPNRRRHVPALLEHWRFGNERS